MKTISEPKQGFPRKPGLTKLAAIALVSAAGIHANLADIPDRPPVSLSGMYQVAASNDPLFPKTSAQEWFLDFGNGTQSGVTSGKVAVSLRQNPRVSVRIMVWQYFPREQALLIGNQTAEGSGRAVARGVWTMGQDADAIFLNRDNRTIVLKRADPQDY